MFAFGRLVGSLVVKSACTCVGEDHPGPTNRVGRNAPEIDALEAQVATRRGTSIGEASQSAQMAPYNAGYVWDNSTAVIHDASITTVRSAHPNLLPLCCSVLMSWASVQSLPRWYLSTSGVSSYNHPADGVRWRDI
jgi:hypothetical protein